jgi:hypothetical protein
MKTRTNQISRFIGAFALAFVLSAGLTVAAAPAGGNEGAQGAGKAIQRCLDGLVAECLPGLGGERGVNLRRFAVFDRVAENRVAVHVSFAGSEPRRARSK